MAGKNRTLTDGEIAFVKEEARLLAADLAFYARMPVRLHLIGGNQYAFTINAGGGGSFLDMYLNPKVLFEIRNRERAIRVWRGMGIHELAHHLWPAKDQYEQAKTEGDPILFDMLNLLDDEQNERNARAMNPEWGECLQTTVAWVFRGKDSSGDEYHQRHSAVNKGEIEATAGTDLYRARRNEFAYHFRRNLPAASDPLVIEALALIPRHLKDISKAELLELARRVVTTLARGLELPRPLVVTVAKEAEEEKKPAEVSPWAKGPPKAGPSLPAPSFWRALIRSRWSYLLLGAFVLGWFSFFARAGFEGWDGAFWTILTVSIFVLGFAGLMMWIDHQRRKRARKAIAARAIPGRWQTAREAVASAWHKTQESTKRAAAEVLDKVSKAFWRLTPKPLRPFFAAAAAALSAVAAGIWWIGKWVWRALSSVASAIAWAGRKLWQSRAFRMFVLAAPIAALLVMLVAVFLKAIWWMLIIVLILLLLLLLLAWLFRKKIKRFLAVAAEDKGPAGGTHGDDYDDSAEMLEFNVISNVVPVEANEEMLRSLLPDVIPLSQELRAYLEHCGRIPVDLEDQETGHDLVEDLEKAALGETALCVDEEEKPAASVHIEMLIDCSGSMGGAKIQLAQRFGLLVEESVRGVRGITANLWGFTETAIYDCGQPGQFRVSGLTAGGGNNDAGALWHAYKSARKSGKELKILLMISDGRPTECTWGSLYKLVCQLEMSGYVPVQVAVDRIEDPAFKRYFVDLVGQPMAAAVIQFGRMLLSLIEEQR